MLGPPQSSGEGANELDPPPHLCIFRKGKCKLIAILFSHTTKNLCLPPPPLPILFCLTVESGTHRKNLYKNVKLPSSYFPKILVIHFYLYVFSGCKKTLNIFFYTHSFFGSKTMIEFNWKRIFRTIYYFIWVNPWIFICRQL